MERNEIKTGVLLKCRADDSLWRIIGTANDSCVLIGYTPKSERADFKVVGIPFILPGDIYSIAEEQYIFTLQKALPSGELKRYEAKKKFIYEVAALYSSDYRPIFDKQCKTHAFRKLYAEYGFSKPLALRTLRRWLQSGMQEYSLADPRYSIGTAKKPYVFTERPGRKSSKKTVLIRDARMLEAFEFGRDLYLKVPMMTKERAYEEMIDAYYYNSIEAAAVGEDEYIKTLKRPTKRQFGYYLDGEITEAEDEIKKTSDSEYENNKRLLRRRVATASMRPMALVEIDEVEVDFYLVAVDNSYQLVGKPKVYMITDVFSHCIVAVGIAFEANSYLGVSNAMMNLLDDKEALCRASGSTIAEGIWPTGYLPDEIHCDGGSELTSDDFLNMCRELGITRTKEPPAMGSMKGMIEQSFRLFQRMISIDFQNKGYVRKCYDSNHREKACLTIEDFKKLVYLFVAYHNVQWSDNYPVTKDMIANKVRKTPIDIWNYGIKRNGQPRTVTEAQKETSYFYMMPERTATISKKGIIFNNLVYYEVGDSDLTLKRQMAKKNADKRDKNGSLLNQMTVRMDPRSTNCLYYLKGGKIMKLFLNNDYSGSYRDMTFSEYLEYRKTELKNDSDNEDYQLLTI